MDKELSSASRNFISDPKNKSNALRSLGKMVQYGSNINLEDFQRCLKALEHEAELSLGVEFHRLVVSTILSLHSDLRIIPSRVSFGSGEGDLKKIFAGQNAFSYASDENIMGLVYWDMLRQQEPVIIRALLRAGVPLRIRPDQVGELGPYQDQVRWIELYSGEGNPSEAESDVSNAHISRQRERIGRVLDGLIPDEASYVFNIGVGEFQDVLDRPRSIVNDGLPTESNIEISEMNQIEEITPNQSSSFSWRRIQIPRHKIYLREFIRFFGLMEEGLRSLNAEEQIEYIQRSSQAVHERFAASLQNSSPDEVRAILSRLCMQSFRTSVFNQGVMTRLSQLMRSLGYQQSEINRIIFESRRHSAQNESGAIVENEEILDLPYVDPMSLKLPNLKKLALLSLNDDDHQKSLDILRGIHPVILHFSAVGIDASHVLQFISDHYSVSMGMGSPISFQEIEALSFSRLTCLNEALPIGHSEYIHIGHAIMSTFESMKNLKKLVLDEVSKKSLNDVTVFPLHDPSIELIDAHILDLEE
ncbi:MAG: hypothetical protein P1V18_02720 [Candidatus Gracilibacteria bacterium]|nr:hypothetical protein [Candidatus Gracilibacteria bacterium]